MSILDKIYDDKEKLDLYSIVVLMNPTKKNFIEDGKELDMEAFEEYYSHKLFQDKDNVTFFGG